MVNFILPLAASGGTDTNTVERVPILGEDNSDVGKILLATNYNKLGYGKILCSYSHEDSMTPVKFNQNDPSCSRKAFDAISTCTFASTSLSDIVTELAAFVKTDVSPIVGSDTPGGR